MITKLSKVWPLQQYIQKMGQPRVCKLILGPNKLSLFPLHISCAILVLQKLMCQRSILILYPKWPVHWNSFEFSMYACTSLLPDLVSLGTLKCGSIIENRYIGRILSTFVYIYISWFRIFWKLFVSRLREVYSFLGISGP